MRKLFLIILVSSTLFSCSKVGLKCTPPPVFYEFILTNNKQQPYFDQKADIKLYYLDNNGKHYINDLISFDLDNNYKYGYGTGIAPIKSADDNIKTFYLELSGNDTDTLYLNYKLSKGNDCDSYELIEDKFNGKAVEATQMLSRYIHVLKK